MTGRSQPSREATRHVLARRVQVVTAPLKRLAGLTATDPGLSVYLHKHVATEADILKEYRRIADACHPSYVAYLIRLICEDEDRHHRIFEDWERTLRPDDPQRDSEPLVPELSWGVAPRYVVAVTAHFLDVERRDLRALRSLSLRLRRDRDATIWPLLVKLIRHDTKKHIAILKFIRDQARRAQTAKTSTPPPDFPD